MSGRSGADNACDGPEQLPLELPHRSALAADDFLVSQANLAAVTLIEQWPNWPGPTILIHGPSGSGKSHLVSVWRARSGADVIAGADLNDGALARLDAGGALAVDGIDSAPVGGSGGIDERVLFHLINRAREIGGHLLLTARAGPGALHAELPDLRSRLRALANAEIAPPDDTLLQAMLVKLFADRQIQVEPAVIQYLVRHMDRSAEMAVALVAAIDRASLAHRRRVTRVLAGEVLQRLQSSGASLSGSV